MDRLNKLSSIAVALLLILLLVRGGMSMLVFLPRLSAGNADTVARAYMQSQQWALNGTARGAWAPDYKTYRNGQGTGGEFFNEVFLASDMTFQPASPVELGTLFEEEVQVIVSYRSLWQGRNGEPPGQRNHAIYLARNPSSPWKVVGEQAVAPPEATPAP